MNRRGAVARACCAALAFVALGACASDLDRVPDINYVPTPQEIVDDMLRLANVRTGDVLYDLGSGDGRIPITAARDYGVRAVGIEINPRLVAVSRENARAARVAHLVEFRREDLFRIDFSEASVVTLYLFAELNEKLLPILLRQLKPGSRVVSHEFPIGDWAPEKTLRVGRHVVHFWTVPSREARLKPYQAID